MKYILGLASTLFFMVGYSQPNFNWADGISGADNVISEDIAVDKSGNSIIVGWFSGTADFDPGPGTYNMTSPGTNLNVFILKLDNQGNFMWAVNYGTADYDRGRGVCVDTSGNIYATGHFRNTVDFDPGSGTTNMTSKGIDDVFVVKLDPNGNFIWVKTVGSSAQEECQPITFDPNGYILVGTWITGGTVDFDPGPGTANITTTGTIDCVIWKLDLNGTFVWAKQMSGSGSANVQPRKIGVDNSGNVVVGGDFQATADFDPGASVNSYTSNGIEDIFLVRLDKNGNHLWSHSYGDTYSDRCRGIDIDTNGDIVVSGYFYPGTIDFDPGPGVYNMTNSGGGGSTDAYVVKYTSSGNLIWAAQIGGLSNQDNYGVHIGASGDIYSTGKFSGNIDFDPGAGTYSITSVGRDAYVQKLDKNGKFLFAVSIGGTSAASYSSGIALGPNETIYFTGRYDNSNIDFDPGPGTYSLSFSASVDCYVVKLDQCSNTTSSINPTACTSYTSPSGKYTWTTSNTYTDTIKNVGGCDSVITINLTINNPVTGIDMITACDSITWIDGNTYYTNNNTATDTIVGGAANGCDSIVTLNLTINTVNATTTASNDTITASATGATYQWLDCDNNYAVISGATNQMFIATANGHYAVAVTQNGCTDTSACVTVTGVGIDENSLGADVKVYPNPTTGIIHIDPGQVTGEITMKITSIDGRVMHQAILHHGKVNNIKLNGEAGMYIVEIKSNTGASMNYRILKQ